MIATGEVGMGFLVKTLISALLVALVSEVSKRSTLLGALLASLPLTSLLGMIWIYQETEDLQKVASFSREICWLVIPSLLLFIIFPVLIDKGYSFWASLGIATTAMLAGYMAGVKLLA
jgi:F0F1-type ATP synthase assembly protein I